MASLADGPKWSAPTLAADGPCPTGPDGDHVWTARDPRCRYCGTIMDDDTTELDEHGQLRLGVAGEQRGFPGMSAGPAPAPTTAEKIDCHGCGYSHYQPACD